MTPAEVLARRASERRAEMADLDNCTLIQAAFGKPEALKPMKTPFQAGGMLRRQAD